MPWWPIGVRNATTAPSAVQTTNGVGGRPKDCASAIAIGPSSAVVAASLITWVSSAATLNMTSSTANGDQPETTWNNQCASRSAVPVCSIAMPSGITPAIITKMRTSMPR